MGLATVLGSKDKIRVQAKVRRNIQGKQHLAGTLKNALHPGQPQQLRQQGFFTIQVNKLQLAHLATIGSSPGKYRFQLPPGNIQVIGKIGTPGFRGEQ